MTLEEISPDSTFNWLKKNMQDLLGVPPEKLSPASTLADLGIDSLAQLQLIVMAENELGASIPDSALTQINLHSLETLSATIDTYRNQCP
ncbi:Acyl carrier protein [Desulfomicrobium apsheronum]|uniref:Acyl carrier protein n=1 Tax=Desulfomicrobium apsheronum TaxID=52560 RepID=A0A1I3VUS6_9BACT|nr:acyl carrier protein [Desulfomicrobium apsheronum]SFJ98057.1 Acyl carrier protein [Desulfomicrobium apsheronum]